MPLHDLKDFDSLCNELRLKNLYHLADVMNLLVFALHDLRDSNHLVDELNL